MSVWYDEFSLRLGDSLRRSIEKGLAGSRFGVVVLSPAFFAKEWPQRELDALTSLEISGKGRVLPIWLDVDHDTVQQHSLLLADKVAVSASEGLDTIVSKLNEAIYPERLRSDEEVIALIDRYMTADTADASDLIAQAEARLEAIASYRAEVSSIEIPESVWETDSGFKNFFDPKIEAAKKRFSIPRLLYHHEDVPLSRFETQRLKPRIKKWHRGKLSSNDSYDLFFSMDEEYDMDCLYVLFGLPNFAVSPSQHSRLRKAIVHIVHRNLDSEVFNEGEAYKYAMERWLGI